VVAPSFETVDVVLLDAQRGEVRLGHHGCAEVGADVEEVVLHVSEDGDHVVVETALGDRQAEVGVGLVDVGVRDEARIGLGGLAHVAQAGPAGVAGAGVDAGEVDHAVTVDPDTSSTRTDRWAVGGNQSDVTRVIVEEVTGGDERGPTPWTSSGTDRSSC
jgi:hypothetical protein